VYTLKFEQDMKTVPFTEFRKHSSDLFTEVEQGETIVVVRHGRPIAEVSPVSATTDNPPSWKRPRLKLVMRGAGLSRAILEERADEDLP
jgi:prevent-host-death family protein